MKENDYFLNYIQNPTFSPTDFQYVGLNADNTSIESKDTYKNLQFIQTNPLLQTDGKFDEHKFDVAYNNALYGWNQLTDTSTSKSIVDQAQFYRNDIFAPPSTRNQQPEFIIHRESNPNRQLKGFQAFNQQSSPQWSMREIAETQKVWDEKTKSWQESPNDSFFGHFSETRVLAQWDEDGTHIDPISGQEVQHKKGDKKLNANGTYYYENLGDRDIYGREVLSKWDTLTRDGSFANKFDFFDSDDLDKSIGGTAIKNIVKIVPAFASMAGIPYVAPIYLSLRVGLNFMDIMPKIGKIFTGSDSPVLSKIEGLAHSFELSSSDYASQHAWAVENIINLSADVFTQLAEQRWLFEYAPSLIKGDKLGFSKEAREKWMEKQAQENAKNMLGNLTSAVRTGRLTQEQLLTKSLQIQTVSQLKAQSALEELMSSRTKLGEYLSKAYMTAVTVGDSYGEAKQQGLSDTEAAIFTLGYAAGEWGILNTGIGEWILPELRMEKSKMRQVINTLAEAERPKSTSPKVDRIKWYQKLFDTAKNFYEANYSMAGTASRHMIANAMGEGIEEVSEELLADFSKSLFNASAWLRGDESRLNAWENMSNRYGLSFVGGVIGGGLGQALPSYQEARKLKDLDKTGAFQELVHMVKEGKAGDLLAEADRMQLGDQFRSAKKAVVYGEDGTPGYAPYTEDGVDVNWDQAIKSTFRQQVKFVQDVLAANGAMVTDEEFLDEMTLKALRFAELQNSSVAASYLQDFNTLASKIVDVSKQIHDIEHPVGETDKKVELTEEDNARLSSLRSQLTKLLNQKDSYLDGTMSKEFIADALFEMTEDLAGSYIPTNFIRFAEASENKRIEEIDKPKLEQLRKEWSDFSEYSKADKIRFARRIFTYINERVSNDIANHNINYFQNSDFLRDLESFFIHAEDRINPNAKKAIDQSIVEQGPSMDATTLQQHLNDIYSLGDSINPRLAKQFHFTLLFLSQLPEAQDMVRRMIAITKLSDNHTTVNAETGEVEEEGIDSQLTDEEKEAFRAKVNAESFESITSDQIKTIKRNLLNQLISEGLFNNATKLIDLIKSQKFMNRSTRDFIQDYVIELLHGVLDQDKYMDIESLDEEIQEEYYNLSVQIQQYQSDIRKAINTLPYSPVAELVDRFQVAAGDKSQKVSELIEYLDNLMKGAVKNKDISEYGYDADTEEKISQALELIGFLKSHIQAARKDAVSFTNIFGYNTTMNELNPDKPKLAEIDVNTANVILQDIDKLETNLMYYKTIFEINSGSKLTEHKKIGAKIWIKTFDKIKAVFYVPDDLGNDEESINLKKAIASAQVTTSLLGATDINLTDEQSVVLLKEQLEVEEALYKFLNKNIDKLDKFINANNFANLIDTNSQVINKDLQNIQDSDFIWYLATITAVNSKKFYKAYANAITDTFAPIPGQELAVRSAFAFIANKKIFDVFTKSYNNTVKQLIENLTDDQLRSLQDNKGLAVSKRYPLNSDVAIISRNHFLVEGIPGAGKSTGFYATLINLLNNVNPALLNKLWIVHLTKDDADRMLSEIAKAVNIADLDKKVTTMGKSDYLLKISGNKWNQAFDEKGNVKVDINTLRKDEDTGMYHYDFDTDKTIDKPSLVLFDEFTHFSQQDLLFSDKFLNELEIVSIATGDFDQSKLVGEVKVDGGTEQFGIHRNNFPHSFKMGQPIRTNSKIKGSNTELVRRNLDKLQRVAGNGNQGGEAAEVTITLQYAQTQEGLFGDKVLATSDDYKPDIQLMLDTLQEGEQITFLYNNKESDLYKYINGLNSSGTHAGKFNIIKGTAQSKEGQYFIVEVDKNESVFDLYTQISRAKQATLLIGSYNGVISSMPVSNPGRVTINQEAIKNFGETRKANINSALEGQQVEDFDWEKDFGKPKKQNESSEQQEEQEETEGQQGGQQENSQEDQDNTDDEGIDNRRKTDQLNKRYTSDISNADDRKYISMLHTFNTLETGFDSEDDGTLVRGELADSRIDSLNGLLKLGLISVDADGKLQNPDEALELLASLHNLIMYTRPNRSATYEQNLLKQISSRLRIPADKIKLNFAYKSQMFQRETNGGETTTYENGYEYFGYGAKEQVIIVNGARSKEAKQPRTKKFVLLVNVDGKNVLEIPFATLTNPISMMHSKGFEEILDAFNNLPDKQSSDGTRYKDIKDLVQVLEQHPCKNSKSFLVALKIYLNNKNNIVYLSKFDPSKFKLTGIQPVVDEKGTWAYEFSQEYEYEGDWKTIPELQIPGRTISKNVYTTTEDYPGYKIKKGHSFILITDDPNLRGANDDVLIEYYLNKEYNKDESHIKLIYVTAPVLDLRQYFENMASAFRKKKAANKREDDSNSEYDPDMGNLFTSFRVLQAIMHPDSQMGKRIRNYLDNVEEGVKGLKAKETWEGCVKLVNAIAGKETQEEQISLLKSKLGNSELSGIFDGKFERTEIRYILQNMIGKFILSADPSFAFGQNDRAFNVPPKNATDQDAITINDNIYAVISDLKNSNIMKGHPWTYGIFYRIPLMPSTEANSSVIKNGVRFVVNKTTDYSVSSHNGNIPLYVNGKTDTAAFVFDQLPLLKEILTGLNNQPKHLNRYNNHSIVSQEDEDKVLQAVEELKTYGVYPGTKFDIRSGTDGPFESVGTFTKVHLVTRSGNLQVHYTKQDGAKVNVNYDSFIEGLKSGHYVVQGRPRVKVDLDSVKAQVIDKFKSLGVQTNNWELIWQYVQDFYVLKDTTEDDINIDDIDLNEFETIMNNYGHIVLYNVNGTCSISEKVSNFDDKEDWLQQLGQYTLHITNSNDSVKNVYYGNPPSNITSKDNLPEVTFIQHKVMSRFGDDPDYGKDYATRIINEYKEYYDNFTNQGNDQNTKTQLLIDMAQYTSNLSVDLENIILNESSGKTLTEVLDDIKEAIQVDMYTLDEVTDTIEEYFKESRREQYNNRDTKQQIDNLIKALRDYLSDNSQENTPICQLGTI